MRQLSRRGREIPASPIRKLVPLADAAKQRGVHVHHVNIGQPDVESPKEFIAAIRAYDAPLLPYGHSSGLVEYRSALADYYRGHGIDVAPEHVFVTTGGSEAILFTLLAIADPGDEILVFEPFYTNYNGFAREAGLKLVPVTSRIEEGFKLPPISEMEARVTERTRAILLCNPNNPTGHVYSSTELDALRDLALKYDLYFLSDEVYREFVYDGSKAHSVMSLTGLGDRAVLLDSVSKRFSACGARVGAIVTRNRDLFDAVLKMGQARLCPPTLEQLAAKAALGAPAEYMERVVSEYAARRDAVLEELAEVPGVLTFRPGGAFYTVARLPVHDAESFSRWLLTDFELDGETVMVAPAAGFYATPGLGEDEVRIAFVLGVEKLRRAMRILKAALAAHAG